MITTLSLAKSLGTPPMYLPTVSNKLNVNIIKRLYHAPLFSTSFMNIILVSKEIPGKAINVTTKIEKRATRNCHD
jgi:hypothetical protein